MDITKIVRRVFLKNMFIILDQEIESILTM